jgi:hypothetical protein
MELYQWKILPQLDAIPSSKEDSSLNNLCSTSKMTTLLPPAFTLSNNKNSIMMKIVKALLLKRMSMIARPLQKSLSSFRSR